MKKIASLAVLILSMSLPIACSKSKTNFADCRKDCLQVNRAKGQQCGNDKTCIQEAIKSVNACYAACDAK